MKHSNKENINNNPQKAKQKNKQNPDTQHTYKTNKETDNKTKEKSKSKKPPEQETQNGIELPLLNNTIAKQEADQYWSKLNPKLKNHNQEILNHNIEKMIKDGKFEFVIYTNIKKPNESILTPDNKNIKKKFLFPLFIYQDKLLELGYTFASLVYYDKPKPTIVAKIQPIETSRKKSEKTTHEQTEQENNKEKTDTIPIKTKLLKQVQDDLLKLATNEDIDLNEYPGLNYIQTLPLSNTDTIHIKLEDFDNFDQDMIDIFNPNPDEQQEPPDINNYRGLKKLWDIYKDRLHTNNEYNDYNDKWRAWQKQFEENINTGQNDPKTQYQNERDSHPYAITIEIDETQLSKASNEYYKQQNQPESRKEIETAVKKAIDNINNSNKFEFSLEHDDIFTDKGFTNEFLNRIAAYIIEAQKYNYTITDWYCYLDKNDSYTIVGRLENQQQKIKDKQAENKLKRLVVEGAILFGINTLGNLFIDNYWKALKWIWDTTTSPMSIPNLSKTLSKEKSSKPKKDSKPQKK